MDKDTQEVVEQKSKRMISHAMYLKLKDVIDAWKHEERGKAKVVAGAFYGLCVFFLVFIVAVIYFPYDAVWVLLFGLLAWIGLYVILIFKYLRRAQ